METFLSFFQGTNPYIVVPIMLLFAVIIATSVGNYLMSVPPKNTLSTGEASADLPLEYTWHNVQLHEVYFIQYRGSDGKVHQQEFQILSHRKNLEGFFRIGVYPSGGQAEGQGHFAFTGWTCKVLSSQRLSVDSLIQERPQMAIA